MYNRLKGYHKVEKRTILPNKYYVMCLKNLRKPYLLRFCCDTPFLAKKYIVTYPSQWVHEVIKGDKALERGVKLTRVLLESTKEPCKYVYPPHIVGIKAKKQARCAIRLRLYGFEKNIRGLKQFTIKSKGITYTTHYRTYSGAYHTLFKYCNLSWDHFIKNVKTKPQYISKNTIFIKSFNVGFTLIQEFNKLHGIKQVKRPTHGTIAKIDERYFILQGAKPKSLNLTKDDS